jgi:RHS repeat-associated protein
MSIIKSVVIAMFITTAALSATNVQAAGNHDRKRVVTTVKPLDLSHPPSTDEIMAAGQLGGALYPTHDEPVGKTGDAMNHSFGTAMEKWNRHEYREAAKLLKKHVKDHPKSPWVAEAVLHLGCDAQYNGRYVEAQKHFERILKDHQGKSHPGAKVLVDKAKLRMGVLKAFQNNLPEAQGLFADLYRNAGDWRERTYAGHWIQRLGKMKRNATVAQNCGNQALAALLERDGRMKEAATALAANAPTDKGHSVRDMEVDSARYGFPLVARSFEPGQADALAAPAIVHLPAVNSGDSGHYWLFEGKDADSLKFFDPQAGKHFVQTADEFAEQWNGIALVRADSAEGKPLDKELSGAVFGGCCGVPRAEDDLGCPDGKCKKGPSMNGATPYGSPTWTVNMVNMNFYMTDIPLWYQSPIGPAVEIQLSYNSQSAIATNEPFGNKWQFNYASYLVVDTASEVTIFMPDGRRDVYRPNFILSPQDGYQSPYRVFNTLKYLGPNLFELTLPDGTVYKYAIPAGTNSLQPFLVEIRDAYGQKLTFGYNLAVQLISITDALSQTTSLLYDGNGLVTRVTDPFGRHAAFSYDVGRNLTGITDMGGYPSTFSYDANVNLTGITNGGGTWQVYIEPADGIDNGTVKYPLPGDGMWENYRHTVTNPQGGKEEYYYDGYHGVGWYKSPRHYGTAIKTIAYDFTTTASTSTGKSRGELSSIQSPEGVLTSFSYDANGQITAETDGHGHITNYVYNTKGRVTSKTLPNLQTTTMGYAINGFDLTSITDGLGSVVIGYNPNRSIASYKDRTGATSTIAYNPFGQPMTVTDSLNTVTSYTYDNSHFLTQVSRNGLLIKSYTYDSLGRVRTVTDATGVTLTFDYNNLDDVTQITWPDGKTFSAEYSAAFPHLVTRQTDRSGRNTYQVFDSLKRLTQATNAEGGISRFSYDKDGNLTAMTSPNGGVTRYMYSNDGMVKTKIEPDGSRTGYSYDTAGLLSTSTNGRGTKASYLYSPNDNLTSVSYTDGTPAITYSYDVYDRLTGMSDAAGAHVYAYDANSRLTTIDGPLANDTVSYAYDSEGRRTGITVLGGLATTNTFDAQNRLTKVATASDIYEYGYTGASPRITSLTRPNGSISSFAYDTVARLTAISNKKSDNTTVISSYGYTNDPAKDLRATEAVTGGIVTAVIGSQTGYSYDMANKLLSATTPATYSHDADGNMTGGLTQDGYVFSAQYNARNQLTSYEYTDNTTAVRKTTYSYNGFGFLESINRYTDGGLTEQVQYVRDRSQVYQERSSANGTSDYIWGADYGGGVGGLLGLKRGAAAYHYLYDGKGNVTGIIDAAQAPASGYSYDPFGLLLQKTGSLEQPFRFSTKPFDEQTGLSYFGYRHYSPAIGRWMTRDPLGPQGGLNLYGFSGNNPVNRFDPNGLAYFAFRSLDQSSIINTDGYAIMDYLDLETAHENIFFEDAQGGDEGFFNDGVHSDKGTDPSRYSRKSEYYEDELLREAIKNTKVGKYDVFTNNCQQWATRVKKEYNKRKMARDIERAIKSFMETLQFFAFGPRGGGFY